jgi:hypothetical protein
MTEAELQKQLIPLYWIRAARALPGDAGMHRWVWDLHYTPPVATRHEFPIAAIAHDTPRVPLGPQALPGNYTVRLGINGKSYTAPLVVQMDPRAKATAADLERQFALEMRLASMLTDSSLAIMQAKSIREQLQKLKQPMSDSIKAFDQKLTTILEGSGDAATKEPALSQVNEDVAGLYGAVGQASAAPTAAQQNAAAAAEHDLGIVMKVWNQLKATDLAAINAQLKSAGQAEIRLESNPQMEGAAPNEE